MSFILDALRKSESERRRDAIPDVTHIPLAPARLELPRWVVPVTAVLGAAVVGLAAAWWLSARPAPEPPATTAAAPAGESDGVPPRAAARTAPPSAPERAEPSPATADPARIDTEPARPASGRGVVPLGELAARPTREPSAEPESTPAEAAASPAPRISAEEAATLPRFTDLRARGVALPDLTLELHVYSDTPANRFVFVNGGRYVEGATLDSGQEVLRITPQGVVLSHAGQRFLLLPD